MSRDWRLYLEDMREACRKVARFTDGLDDAAFLADAKTYDAVLRNLEVLGEAAKRIPDGIRQQAPDIEWRRVAGLRDILAHAYFGVDNEILWDIVANKVEPLLTALDQLASRVG